MTGKSARRLDPLSGEVGLLPFQCLTQEGAALCGPNVMAQGSRMKRGIGFHDRVTFDGCLRRPCGGNGGTDGGDTRQMQVSMQGCCLQEAGHAGVGWRDAGLPRHVRDLARFRMASAKRMAAATGR